MNTDLSFALQKIKLEIKNSEASSNQPKYIKLYLAIKACIEKKEMPDQWILPSTRELAFAFKLSRTTVIKSYEMLLLEKLITSKQGSGYRVNFQNNFASASTPKKFNPKKYPSLSDRGKAFIENRSQLNRKSVKALTFKPGLPPIDIFPIDKWKNLLNNYWRYIKSSELMDEQVSGSDVLKKQISDYLLVSRNLKCNTDQIIIVSGSLQSLYLIANSILDKGDSIIIEDPTFPNVHSIFKSCLAELIPLSIDREGIDISKLSKLVKGKTKLIHVTPSNHYPLGVKMSKKRRLEILKWASQNNAYIIENDYENEIANATHSEPSIYSLDEEQRTLYLGTFNRLLFPSIRLGFMVVPSHLTPVLEALQELSHRFVSPLTQFVMGQFIENNHLYLHIKKLKTVAQKRELAFKQIFKENFSKMYLQERGFESLHKVALFKKDVSVENERALSAVLAENDISVFPLSKCYIQGKPKTGFIMGYSNVPISLMKNRLIQMAQIVENSELI